MPDKKLADAYAAYQSGKSRKDLFGEIVGALQRQHDEIVALRINAAKTEGVVALHDAATELAEAIKGALATEPEKRKPGRPPINKD